METNEKNHWFGRLRHELGSMLEVAAVGLVSAGIGVVAMAGFRKASHFVFGLLGVHHRPLPPPIGEVAVVLAWVVVLVSGFLYGLKRQRQLILLSVLTGWIIDFWLFGCAADMVLGGKPRTSPSSDWFLFLNLAGFLAFPLVTMRGQKQRSETVKHNRASEGLVYSLRTVVEVAAVGLVSASIGTLAVNGLFRGVSPISGVPGTAQPWQSPVGAAARVLLWALPLGGGLLYGLRRRRRLTFLSVWTGWWIGLLLVFFTEFLTDSNRSGPPDVKSLSYQITVALLALPPALVTMYGQKRRLGRTIIDIRDGSRPEELTTGTREP